MRLWTAAAALLLAGFGLLETSHAEVRVEVLDTYPAGPDILLPRNQNFQLRLAYASDQPVGIWITPYFRGARVDVGSSPSSKLVGDGETLAWFFFMKPGDEVDEIRISAGDGGTKTTPTVATHRVHIVSGTQPAVGDTPPAWVAELGARATAARKLAADARQDAPVRTSDRVLVGGFMLAMYGLCFAGFAAPLWMLRRWRGGWRVAALVPMVLMGFVVLRILVGTARDPTSHNLWPFEILMAGLLSIGVTAVLAIARRFGGARRAS